MGSGAETAHETVEYLTAQGEKVGVLKVRLYRPFCVEHFCAALPATVKTHRRARPHQGARRRRRAAVPGRGRRRLHEALRRTAASRPCRASSAAATACRPRSSRRPWSRPSSTSCSQAAAEEPLHRRHQRRRDRTPACDYDPDFDIEDPTTWCAPCSTAWAPTAPSAPTRTPSRSSARRPTTTPRATSSTTRRRPAPITVSHLRFGPRPIRSTYLISQANFVACHQFTFLERFDMLERAPSRARRSCSTAPYGPDEVWDQLPREVQQQIIDKKLQVLRHRRLRGGQDDRHGRAHQHDHADLLLRHLRRAAARTRPSQQIKKAIEKTYGKKGEAVVQKNFAAVDADAGPPARGRRSRPQATSTFDMPAGRAGRGAGVRPAASPP